MTRRSLGTFTTLALMGGLVLSACSSPAPASSTPPSAQKITVKLGIELPLSGAETSNGQPTAQGAELAIAQANAAQSNITFVETKLDDAVNGKHDPAQGANNVRTFCGDTSVLGYVGPFNSSVAKAEMPIANACGLVNISPSNTNPTLTKPEFGLITTLRPTGKVTYFRVATTDDIQGPAGADYAYQTLNLRKAYVIDDQETYGKGIADTFSTEFQKLGGTVLTRDSFPGTTTDFTAALTAAQSKGPDLVYFGGTDTTGGDIIKKQMATVGMTAWFCGGDGVVTGGFLDTVGSAAGNSCGTVAAAAAGQIPSAGKFLSDYKAKFGTDAGPYSAPAFDAMNALITAIEQAYAAAANKAPSRDQVAAQMLSIKAFHGSLGDFGFDANGDITNRIISTYVTAQATATPNDVSGSASTGWIWQFKMQKGY